MGSVNTSWAPFARFVDLRDPAIERVLKNLDIVDELIGDCTRNCDVLSFSLSGNSCMLNLELGRLLPGSAVHDALGTEFSDFCCDARAEISELLAKPFNIL
jgi:hypothetical protein